METNWISYVVVAFVAFMLGRWSKAGSGGDVATSPEMRQLAVQDNIARLSPGARAEAEMLIRDGKLIHAIKRVRQDTGLGLRDAKQAVDELKRQLG